MIVYFYKCINNNTDLAEVLREVYDARTKWYNIGLELKINPADLDAIRFQYRDNPDECFRELLSRWLRQGDPKPTWVVLANALESPTVGFGCLSKELYQKPLISRRDSSTSISSVSVTSSLTGKKIPH